MPHAISAFYVVELFVAMYTMGHDFMFFFLIFFAEVMLWMLEKQNRNSTNTKD